MTHTEKDCFSRPRKRGAHLTNKDIQPDEYINKELNLSYEGKRDHWKGYFFSSIYNFPNYTNRIDMILLQ